MKSFKISILAMVAGLVLLTLSHAQSPDRRNPRGNPLARFQLTLPAGFQDARTPHSWAMRFLASEEGRGFLKATGHPLAKYAIAAFGEPSKNTVVPAQWFQQAAEARQDLGTTAPTSAPCNASNGVRFNLEPRVKATTQNQAQADFLLNRIAPGDDLIVQGAQDWRGAFPSNTWDNSVSGYYVHASSTADCSVQFEGGLPTFTFQGDTEMGIGDTFVAADPARDAFFAVDLRFGTNPQQGIGLFRTSASTLLDPKACPSGTHLQAQAASCWMTTPPVFMALAANAPRIAIDERATNAGVGAGDVYVVADPLSIFLVACTNGLNCGQSVLVSGSDSIAEFPDVQVRPDGVITVSYIVVNSVGNTGADIKFATCIPAGAPKPPVCGKPTLVTHLANNLLPNNTTNMELVNYGPVVFTFPKHANRADSGNNFTSFLVYDDCKSPFTQGNPPFTVCIDAEVMMTASTDGGQTWSAPVSVDTAPGHHFLPSITTDTSIGIVHITYYSAEGDKFNHMVRVFRNQINPGGVQLGPAQAVTKLPDTIDNSFNNAFLLDLYMGAKSRGNGVSGQSRLYMSFDSTLVPGTYEGEPAPDANNNIIQVSY